MTAQKAEQLLMTTADSQRAENKICVTNKNRRKPQNTHLVYNGPGYDQLLICAADSLKS